MTSSLRSIFDGAETRVLLIGGERAILYLFHGREIAHAYIFGADQAGLAGFRRCLAEIAPAPLGVLVDVVEEEYRQETIPHVSGADRRAVLARKYARLFRGTPYHAAQFQGRESGERRDDRVLLTAITRPEVLTPWLDLLLEQEVPVIGIYSLPMLSERLLKPIGATGPNVLLISLQKASGLRQSFFRDGQLKISRLALVPRLGSVPFAANLMSEVEKLRRYLNSLALISRDSPLTIYILSHGQLLAELEQHCRDGEQEKYFLLDTADVARRLGLEPGSQSHYADAVLARLLVGRPPARSYAQPDETRFYTLHRLRTALAGAGVALVLASAAWSGFNFIEGVILKEQALDASEKARFYQERFEMARAKLPETPVEPREIKTAVDLVAALAAARRTPAPVLALVGEVLAGQPAVRLDRLDWRGRATGLETTATPGSLPEGVAEEGVQVAELTGHLAPFDGDYRNAIATVDALAQALRAQGEVAAVEVLQYPLDLRSDASVSGSTTGADDRTVAAFRLRFMLEVPDGGQES